MTLSQTVYKVAGNSINIYEACAGPNAYGWTLRANAHIPSSGQLNQSASATGPTQVFWYDDGCQYSHQYQLYSQHWWFTYSWSSIEGQNYTDIR